MNLKYLITIILLSATLHNLGEAKDDDPQKINLKGWSLYNKNKDFGAEQLYKDGVVPREKIIQKLKKNKIRTVSDDKCFSLLTKTKIIDISEFKNIPKAKQLEFCLKAANYSPELFSHVYPYISKTKKVQLFNLLKREGY